MFLSTGRATSLFEDPRGGIFLLGGALDVTSIVPGSIFYLRDAGPLSKWELYSATLKRTTSYMALIPVPDYFANCTLV